ncbi:FecR family protein [Pedobacter gandavensis]|uniref:FecR family protein n=1 Tax=Pedobacter gandavensis TaxID=2679963 RepID=UPI00292E8FB1|nr:FecR domain-containing protein [Pedobacter gandavensis]
MYTIEQLILDPTFLNYCYQSNEQDVQTWTDYAAGSPENKATVAEARKMLVALNQMLKSREEKIALSEFKKLAAQQGHGTMQAHNAMEETGEEQSNSVLLPKRRSFVRVWYATAAAVLLVTGFAFFNHYQQVQQADLAIKKEQQVYQIYKAPFGQRMSITLADHSKVILNANSILKVPHGYNKENRRVLLSGAAYFDISPNAELPFIMETSDMKATVLGTGFYMRAYPHESGQQVELLSGKLKVQKAYTSDMDNEAEIILPGEMVMLNRSVDLMEKETFDVQQRESWVKGQLKFKNTSFAAVLTALEDWYGVPIEIRGAEKSAANFSGTFENESLERVLNMFCFATDCSFKIEKEKVILRFN